MHNARLNNVKVKRPNEGEGRGEDEREDAGVSGK